jgi:hypothetical protein
MVESATMLIIFVALGGVFAIVEEIYMWIKKD